jgi:hypothetical protein
MGNSGSSDSGNNGGSSDGGKVGNNRGSSDGGKVGNNRGSSDGGNVSYVGTVCAGDSYYQEVSYKDGSSCTTVGDASSNVSVSTCTSSDGSKTTSVDVGDIKTVTVASVDH